MDMDSKFQMHCSIYKIKSAWRAGQKSGISKYVEETPRYWITVGKNKEIVWDFPNNYLNDRSLVNGTIYHISEDKNTVDYTYFWPENYKWVAKLIREYIDTPKNELLTKQFNNDYYGLLNVLRKYDRRISKQKRAEMN